MDLKRAIGQGHASRESPGAGGETTLAHISIL